MHINIIYIYICINTYQRAGYGTERTGHQMWVCWFVWQLSIPDWDLWLKPTGTYTPPYMQKHVQEARSLNQIQGRTPFESQSSRFAHSIYI